MLRSNGINNDKILFSIEKLPPHYFENLLGSCEIIDKVILMKF